MIFTLRRRRKTATYRASRELAFAFREFWKFKRGPTYRRGRSWRRRRGRSRGRSWSRSGSRGRRVR